MIGILVAALVAALVTVWVTPYVQRWSERKGAIDQPEARRVNKQPIPRAGGVAMFLGFLIAVLLTVSVRQWRLPDQPIWTRQVAGILLATSWMAFVGLIDDFKNLSPLKQTLGMVIGAMILVACGVRIEGITNPLGILSGGKYDPHLHWHALGMAVSVGATVVWMFAVTKTVDAIDGLDGLASGVCAISAATLALMAAQLRTPDGPTLALVAAALAGACLGFLRHNYHPARIIMGTIGAWVLGSVLASVSILGAFKVAAMVSVAVPILVLGVPLFDYTHVLARRALEGAKLTQADQRHLHHRLLKRGWNQRQVVWFIYSVAAVLCMAALALFRAGRPLVP